MKYKNRTLMPLIRSLAGVVMLSAIGISTAQTVAGDKPVATLGSASIGQNEIARMLQGMPDAERAAIRGNRAGVENWLRQRLAAEVLLNEAKKNGWSNRPEIRERIDLAVKDVTERVITTTYIESVSQVPADYPSEAELKDAYEKAKGNFKLPVMYRVAQIYLAHDGSSSADRQRDEAKKLSTQARRGDFAALAKSHSQDKRTAERGGDVGLLPLAQLLPEVRDVVAKMKVGDVGEPVRSESGYHIVKLLETQPERTATFEEVRPRLQAALREQRRQQLAQEYLAKLIPAEGLKIDSTALDAALQK
ncbi:peptidylprolyl isomerase [Oxalicibacterium flavum]|uniref:Peptidylprolyl isomerase n=1 Tax=Oxalicibacterium flavum TaxID=179467 RepID=A0A8J2UNC9_9BURK|nr:peptidylprolyl isomerase [Oxalicibacterium flavum]GGB95548.1 peptidylprolyl isomerase [Oxalicibacterium flavum]